jgi:hypothetical protein
MLAIAKLVSETDSPLLLTLQGHPKLRDTIAWIRAYTIVTKFLEQYQMELTLEIFESELGDHRAIPDQSIRSNCVEVLAGLLQFATTLEPNPLEYEVAIFCGQRIVKRTARQAQVSRFFGKEERPAIAKASRSPVQPKERPSWKAPEPEPRKKADPPTKAEPPKKADPPKKAEPVKKAEPLKKAEPPKREEPAPAPAPVFRKPTINDLKAAPAITLDSEIASSSVPEEKSSKNIVTDEETIVEDFESEGSSPEEPPPAQKSSSAQLASDDFDVTVVESGSEPGEEVESVVDEGSLPIGSLRSEMVGESNQMMIQLPSSIVASETTVRSEVKSDLDFEFADKDASASDVIEIVDDFDE